MSWDRIGALSGVLFAVLMMAGFGIGQGAIAGDLDPDSPSATIAKALADGSDQLQRAGIVLLFGLLSFFWFLGYLRRTLQAAEGEGGWLGSVAYGGGLVTVAVMLGLLAIQFAAAAVSAETDTQVAKTLLTIQWEYIILFAPPWVAFTLATSVIAIRFRALPRWVGWVGVPAAVTMLAPWIGIIVVMVWVLVVSIVLLMKTTALERFVR